MLMLLTKNGGWLGPIADILGLIMNGIYEFFYLFGIQNIALSIFVFTFIARALMLPLTMKQQKFTKLSSRMNPELQKIQAKYKGKKDEASVRKQQAETQAIYQKYGANPTAGCLPMLITLPIMFALYRVIYNIPAYVNQVKEMYLPVANAINGVDGYASKLTDLATTLKINVTDFNTTNKIIDLLAKLKTANWEQLTDTFSATPDVGSAVATALPHIDKVNNFIGLNITNPPGWGFPAILIPILAMVLQYIQGKQLQMKNTASNKDNPAASAMNSMNYVMPIMSGIFCIGFPIGVGLYWIASSVFSIIQQFFVNKYLDRMDLDELIEKNVAKASKKKSFKNTPISTGPSLQELAKTQTKSIESTVLDKTNEANKSDTADDSAGETDSGKDDGNKKTSSASSISDIANLLRNRNYDKGDK